MIIGAPQYYLGTYLDKKSTRTNLEYLIGKITDEGILKLNIRLKDRIATSKIQPEHVYFHYSNNEHTYEDHVKDMLADLKSAKVPVTEDIHNYPKHGDLKEYFPPYLIAILKELNIQ